MADKLNPIEKKIRELGSDWIGQMVVWLGDNSGEVETGNPGEYFARQYNGKVITVINSIAIAPKFDARVLVSRSRHEPNTWRIVLGLEDYLSPVSGGTIARHAEQHEEGGFDRLTLDRKQIKQLSVRAAGAFTVQVYGGAVQTSEGIIIVNNGILDLSSYTITAGAKYVSIESDSTGALSANGGAVFSSPNAGTAADIPDPDPGKYSIAYVLLYAGQVSIIDNNIRPILPLPGAASIALFDDTEGDPEDVSSSASSDGSSDFAARRDHIHLIHPFSRLHLDTVDPTVNEDAPSYEVGDIWINETSGEPFICVDNTDGAAVWESLLGGGGSYDLAAEIAGASSDLPIHDSDLFARRQDSSGLIRKSTFLELAADIAPKIDHEDLFNSGSFDHAAIDSHITVGGHVTGGNSHDHNGGDGAQIDHTTLSNIGTNTHAQIDTHIASTSNPHSVTAAQVGAIPDSGWEPVSQTWTYAAADDPVYQIYVSGDVTANADYKLGNKVKCTNNSTTFYGFIVKVGAYDAGNTRTPVDIYGGTDYDLANSAITAPHISKIKSPDGFPLSPAKWTATLTDTTQRQQATPTQNTWYNLDSLSINIPIGIWKVSVRCFAQVVSNAAQTAATAFVTLSTANNSESDSEMTGGTQAGGASGTIISGAPIYVEKIIALTSKTTYYLNTRTTIASMAFIRDRNDLTPLIISALCVYL